MVYNSSRQKISLLADYENPFKNRVKWCYSASLIVINLAGLFLMETYDLIIIGGGPGGVTAAIYALRARMNLIMVERGGIGGQIALSDIIENYPGFPALSGPELMAKFEEHAKKEGLEVKNGMVSDIRKEDGFFTIEMGKESLSAKSIIIATGAEPSELGIKGEREFFGRGVSTCATCDGPFYRGKDVAVIGGGDTAV